MGNLFILDKSIAYQMLDSLNAIEVRGKDNMDILLGVIMVLERALNAPPPTEQEATEEIPTTQESDE